MEYAKYISDARVHFSDRPHPIARKWHTTVDGVLAPSVYYLRVGG